jgi:hypothetical protein
MISRNSDFDLSHNGPETTLKVKKVELEKSKVEDKLNAVNDTMVRVFKVLGKVTGDEEDDDLENHGTESKSSQHTNDLFKERVESE